MLDYAACSIPNICNVTPAYVFVKLAEYDLNISKDVGNQSVRIFFEKNSRTCKIGIEI
jgi:hypothetical protein